MVQATAQEQLTTKAQLPTNTQTTHATMSTRTNLEIVRCSLELDLDVSSVASEFSDTYKTGITYANADMAVSIAPAKHCLVENIKQA